MARILWELLIMKPCPFCGGTDLNDALDTVLCKQCGILLTADSWNHRTPGPATRAMLEIAERNRRPPVEGSGLTVFLVRIAELEAFLAEWKDD